MRKNEKKLTLSIHILQSFLYLLLLYYTWPVLNQRHGKTRKIIITHLPTLFRVE